MRTHIQTCAADRCARAVINQHVRACGSEHALSCSCMCRLAAAFRSPFHSSHERSERTACDQADACTADCRTLLAYSNMDDMQPSAARSGQRCLRCPRTSARSAQVCLSGCRSRAECAGQLAWKRQVISPRPCFTSHRSVPSARTRRRSCLVQTGYRQAGAADVLAGRAGRGATHVPMRCRRGQDQESVAPVRRRRGLERHAVLQLQAAQVGQGVEAALRRSPPLRRQPLRCALVQYARRITMAPARQNRRGAEQRSGLRA